MEAEISTHLFERCVHPAASEADNTCGKEEGRVRQTGRPAFLPPPERRGYPAGYLMKRIKTDILKIYIVLLSCIGICIYFMVCLDMVTKGELGIVISYLMTVFTLISAYLHTIQIRRDTGPVMAAAALYLPVFIFLVPYAVKMLPVRAMSVPVIILSGVELTKALIIIISVFTRFFHKISCRLEDYSCSMLLIPQAASGIMLWEASVMENWLMFITAFILWTYLHALDQGVLAGQKKMCHPAPSGRIRRQARTKAGAAKTMKRKKL